MSQPPHPPSPLSSLPPSNTSPSAPAMTETQKLPVFQPPGFLDFNHRRLPPPIQLKQLEIPPDAVPPRTDYHFRSPVGHLPSIHSGPPPRHEHQQAPTAHYRPAAPLEKLVHHTNPYTPPRTEAPYSPQNYGPPVSPRSQYDSRERRLNEQRYQSYDEPRHTHHAPHEQPYSSLASPVEPSQQRHYAPLPSPGYTPSYASSSTFRGSVGSYSHSQRGSVAAPLGSVAYPEPNAPGPPPRKDVRAIPLPGTIKQPVYNDQL